MYILYFGVYIKEYTFPIAYHINFHIFVKSYINVVNVIYMDNHTDHNKEQIIRKLYSTLVYLEEGKLYMCDKSISVSPIVYWSVGVNVTDSNEYDLSIYTKELKVKVITVVNFHSDHPGDLEQASIFSHNGMIKIDFGERLSDESCMALYKYNLSILSSFSQFIYDRVSIERRHTINSIIK